MSERNGSTPTGPGTAEIPVIRPRGGKAPKTGAAPTTGAAPEPPATAPAPAVGATAAVGEPAAEPASPEAAEPAPGAHPTAPVTVRPAPRMPRRGPLTVMGPWAPVAGGLLGLVLGGIVAAVLGGSAESYDQRLSVVFVVLGLGMLGTAGTLLADEVRIVRQQARDAVVRPQWVEATAGLVNGLTPARLLMLASVVVLVLAAWVGQG
ncbi:hypothetical protein JKP75_08360 [Blastococcus sp. TML/M2B]|uniref:hypothetical protein n=1 Tax=unclassified Blastococcus TaxID=2619396 RepID=UPI00190ABF14|nr:MULTISPECIES: hypothetical protein [unclassified Blastococcus]MBN1092571.1 hypothetical protein [Blastococcus sp. TML/M2B]MBN1097335.1 hypothetical protein [Blastococcus sp. TML/C7B]